jgi:hypothetical protein
MIETLLLSTIIMYQDGGATSKPDQEAKYAEKSKAEKSNEEASESTGVTGEARELFLMADEATRAVKTVRFDVVREGTGSQAAMNSTVKAHVVMKMGEEGARSIAMSGMVYQINDGEPQVIKTQGAMNAEGARRLDYENEALVEGPANISLFGPIASANFQEFGHPTPFSQDEVNGADATIEGRAFVGEVLCDVVWVDYGPNANNAQARWYFGAEDHLPRRVERLNTFNGNAGAIVQTLYNLQVNFKVDETMFAIYTPDGFTVQTIDPGAFFA